MHLEEHEEWITIRQALALNPGLTEGALKQRIRRGTLAAKYDEAEQQYTHRRKRTVLYVRKDQIVDTQAPGIADQATPGNELESSR